MAIDLRFQIQFNESPPVSFEFKFNAIYTNFRYSQDTAHFGSNNQVARAVQKRRMNRNKSSDNTSKRVMNAPKPKHLAPNSLKPILSDKPRK